MSKDVRILPYREGHLDLMVLRPDVDRDAMDKLLSSFLKAPRAYSYTIAINGEVIFIGGVIEVWKGVGEAWAIVSPKAAAHALTIHRLSLPMMKVWFSELGLHRLQATAQIKRNPNLRWEDSLGKNVRWARSLGFQEEAVLKRYGKGQEDHLMLTRFSP